MATDDINPKTGVPLLDEMIEVVVNGGEICPECAEDAGLYVIPQVDDLIDLLQYLEDHGVEARCWDL